MERPVPEGDVKSIAPAEPRDGGDQVEICPADVAHIEKVALYIETADLDSRRLGPSFDARDLCGEGWQNKLLALPGPGMIERAGHDQSVVWR